MLSYLSIYLKEVLLILESKYLTDNNDSEVNEEMIIQLTLDDNLKICKHSIKKI